LKIQSIDSLYKRIDSFFLTYNADSVIYAGTDEVIFLHHAAGKDAGFDLLAFSFADSKTYSWMFVLIAHGKAPFIVGVAAGTIKHPQTTFDYSFLVVKVDYICHGLRRCNIE
jgi:polysaccharide pyruvyl transferase WcaK-like protein